MSNWDNGAMKNYRAGRMSIAGRGSVFAAQPPQLTLQTPAQNTYDPLLVEDLEDMEPYDPDGEEDELHTSMMSETTESVMNEIQSAPSANNTAYEDEDSASSDYSRSDDDDDEDTQGDINLTVRGDDDSQASKTNDPLPLDILSPDSSMRTSLVSGQLVAQRSSTNASELVPQTYNPTNTEGGDSIITSLLEKHKLPWNFDGAAVTHRSDYYRAMAQYKYAANPGARTQFNAHHIPQYYSNQPLLSTQCKRMVSILLPQSEVNSLPPSRPHSTKLVINISDTTDQLLINAVTALYKHRPAGSVDWRDYVFKVVGQHSFMEPGNLVFSYQCVRKTIRDNLDLDLLLIKRPNPLQMSQKRMDEEQAYLNTYAAKVKPAIYQDIDQKHLNQYKQHPLSSQDRITVQKKQLTSQYKDYFNTPLFPYQSNINPSVQQKYIDITDLKVPFNLSIMGLDNLSVETLPRYNQSIVGVYVRVMLFHGYTEYPLEAPTTTVINSSETVLFNEPILGTAATLYANVPRETAWHLLCTMLAQANQAGENANQSFQASAAVSSMQPDYANDIQLAYVVTQLINEQGELRVGSEQFNLWPFSALDSDDKHNKQVGSKRHLDPLFLFRTQNVDNHKVDIIRPDGTLQNPSSAPQKKFQQYGTIRVKFPQFNQPVYSFYPTTPDLVFKDPSQRLIGRQIMSPANLDKYQSTQLLAVLQTDYLAKLSPEQRALLWSVRHYLVDTPHILPKLLQCVDWSNISMRNEAYRLLSQFTPPSDPVQVIILLDACYADSFVRDWAVQVLSLLGDDELKLYLLQLVQCLKYESYHNSSLSRFLINRAVSSPLTIGLTLFWYLKSEMIQPNVAERFTLILEEMLVYIGIYMNYILLKQASMIHKLQLVAEHVWYLKRQMHLPNDEVYAQFHKMLHDFNATYFPPTDSAQTDDDIPYFIIPYLSSLRVRGLVVEKCKYMSSKMVPLWLVFSNIDEGCPPTYLIFKSGDDLRQDLLTLQLLTIFDRVWLTHGLDLCMNPYHVIPTGVNKQGEGVGMIEVVLSSRTVSDIQVTYGGGAKGAFKLDTIDLFLREHNTNGVTYANAVQTFTRSVAGYCVATFILGIGDRHISNLMCQSSGRFFHIDFGHFLGNFKTKFGMKRERTAFVFNRDMAYVIAGSNKDFKKTTQFKNFKNLFTHAFKILRKNVSLFEQLFLLVIPGGLPELNVDTDLNYLRDKLYIDCDTKTAGKQLHEELDKALGSFTRIVDGFIHNRVHA